MLFLFEFLFFVIAIAAVVLIETRGVQAAAIMAVAITALSLVGRAITARRVPLPASRDRAAFHAASEQARWWRTMLDTWAHFNKAMLIGSAVLLVWTGALRLTGQ